MKILVLNGPNLNMLGKRDKSNYGTLTLKEINRELKKRASNHEIKFKQSNYEGKLVQLIQKYRHYDALIINPGAYTHTSIAIRDALELFKGYKVEVHLSNILMREDFRKVDFIHDVCDLRIMGKKEESYYEALENILKQIFV